MAQTQQLSEDMIHQLCVRGVRKDSAELEKFIFNNYDEYPSLSYKDIVLNIIESVRIHSLETTLERLNINMGIVTKLNISQEHRMLKAALEPFDLPNSDILQERYDEDIDTIIAPARGIIDKSEKERIYKRTKRATNQ
ncbi:unnamed protein product [marine sediment metagenome]|uniref:Uncharacterized protein n=1 Tax=marine sediment metagenome TaxID=412755 RepID=X1FKC8_9ZZZZ